MLKGLKVALEQESVLKWCQPSTTGVSVTTSQEFVNTCQHCPI